MAKGQIFVIPSGTQQLILPQSREEKQSVALLNPNDGVCYLKLNGPAGVSSSAWDWKLPSQSYGLFPGPWESLGIFFLDQSGAGRQGEINVYDSAVRLEIPEIHSIGRALQAQATSLDISEGAIPANPPLGVSRLWADNTHLVHNLDAAGIDAVFVDSSMTFGGNLAGPILSPSIAVGGINNVNLFLDGLIPAVKLAAAAASGNIYASGGALVNQAVTISSPVSLTPASTWTNICSVVLGAGIYLIWGIAVVQAPAANTTIDLRLTLNGAPNNGTAFTIPTSAKYGQGSIFHVLGGNITLGFDAMSDIAGALVTIGGALSGYGAGTGLRVLRIG